VAFFVAGAPGIILVLLIKFTLKEPTRGQADGLPPEAREDVPPIGSTLRALFSRKSYIRLVLGGTFGILMVYISGAWLPPFFIRVHGMTPGQIGTWLALSVGAGGAIGSIGGGLLSDQLRKRFPRPEIWILAISTALTCPLLLLTVVSDELRLALAGLFLLNMFAFVWIGPTSATIQRVVPVHSRALAVGIQLSVANIISLTFGPPIVGYVSDLLRPDYGQESIRYALAFASVAAFGGTACYLSAGRFVLRDIQAAEEGRSPHGTSAAVVA
jgi:predicted MFS family arabinose efflux permease